MWSEIATQTASTIDKNNFTSAVEILTNKPHVINKRLCGKNILLRASWSGVVVTETHLTTIVSFVRRHWRRFDEKHAQNFVQEIYDEVDKDCVQTRECKRRKHDDASEPNAAGDEELETSPKPTTQTQVLIVELLPKRLDLFAKLVEIVIIDAASLRAAFIPFMNTWNDHTGSPHRECSSDVAYSVQLVHQSLYLRIFSTMSDTQTKNSDATDEESSENKEQESKRLGDERADESSVKPCRKSLGSSLEYLRELLLPQMAGWLSQTSLNTQESSLLHVNVERYNDVYQTLKSKYADQLVKNWPTGTDPKKFVYEDIAIATYLSVLWEDERRELGTDVKQSFVDLGCGNGLLVFLLSSEGHRGRGIDARKRDMWTRFTGHAELQELAITPSDAHLFPDADWLIGNHSDELTPWIPVMAARSSYSCRYLVLPCCTWDFDRKFAGQQSGQSQYCAYLEYIEQISRECGFHTCADVMRIPSTKKACIFGKKRTYAAAEHSRVDHQITTFIAKRCSASPESQASHADNPQGTPERTSHGWTHTFKVRSEKAPANCIRMDRDVKNDIVTMVTEKLLAVSQPKQLASGQSWNRGGSIAIGDIVGMLDKDTLDQLKNTCGGMQTLLKGFHHIFRVQSGCVQLRDWTDADEAHFLAKRKRKGGSAEDRLKFWKTKLCWFHTNHPDGCPRAPGSCLFAHSTQELRSVDAK